MKEIRFLTGCLVMPFLYARFSFVLFLPLLFIENINLEIILFLWAIYAVYFSMLMGIFRVMKFWSKLFLKIFNIEYEINGTWCSDSLHSYSIWYHPVLKVNGKEHKLSIAVAGGALYKEEDNLNRKAIFYYFFG